MSAQAVVARLNSMCQDIVLGVWSMSYGHKPTQSDLSDPTNPHTMIDRHKLFEIAHRVSTPFHDHIDQLLVSPSPDAVICRAPVKSVERVYQKLARSYNGRVERCCDLVRC